MIELFTPYTFINEDSGNVTHDTYPVFCGELEYPYLVAASGDSLSSEAIKEWDLYTNLTNSFWATYDIGDDAIDLIKIFLSTFKEPVYLCWAREGELKFDEANQLQALLKKLESEVRCTNTL